MTLSETRHALLGTDIIERDAATFTHARKDGRLGWEKTLSEGASLTSFAAASDEDAMIGAYATARDMVAVMNPPQKVNIVIGRGGSKTDGKRMFVSTKHFDDKALTSADKVDIFVGFAIHECCHLLYTDFDKSGRTKLIRMLANIIEDERIEHRLGDEKPGLAAFVAKTKHYAFGRHEERVAGEKGGDLPRTYRCVNAVLKLVRWPESLSDDEIGEFGDLLLKVKEILSPYPASTQEVAEAATKIADLMKEDEKERRRDDRKKEEDGKKSDDDSDNKSEDEGDGASSDDGSDDPSEDNDADDGGSEGDDPSDKDDDGDASEEEGDAPSDDRDTDGSPDEEESGNNEKDGVSEDEEDASSGDDDDEHNDADADGADGERGDDTSSDDKSSDKEEPDDEPVDDPSEDFDAAAGDFDDLTGGDRGRDDEEDEMSQAVKDDDALEKLCRGDLEKGSSDNSLVEPVKNVSRRDERRYDDSLGRVRAYIPAVRRILQCNAAKSVTMLRGMRSGRLDAGKLAEAVQGCDNVYTTRTERERGKLAVCVLVDESGSMIGYCSNGHSRIDNARDAAILLDEALSKVPGLELYVFGHTADIERDGDCELTVYRDRFTHTARALGKVDAKANNADGYAILEAAARVRRQTDRKCLMFVISDGEPAALAYCHTDGVVHTAEAVRKVEAMGFIPVQIAVSSELRHPERMFKRYVVMNDLPDLPQRLGQLVKRAVIEHTGGR